MSRSQLGKLQNKATKITREDRAIVQFNNNYSRQNNISINNKAPVNLLYFHNYPFNSFNGCITCERKGETSLKINIFLKSLKIFKNYNCKFNAATFLHSYFTLTNKGAQQHCQASSRSEQSVSTYQADAIGRQVHAVSQKSCGQVW